MLRCIIPVRPVIVEPEAYRFQFEPGRAAGMLEAGSTMNRKRGPMLGQHCQSPSEGDFTTNREMHRDLLSTFPMRRFAAHTEEKLS